MEILTFGDKIELQVINNENSLVLTDVHVVPPKTNFFFQKFE